MEIAGLKQQPKQHLDGLSLVPLLKRKEIFKDRGIFWHYPHYGNQGGSPSGAIRKGDYKLIEFYEDMHVELYNIKNDIAESENLAEEIPDLTKEMLGEFMTSLLMQNLMQAKISDRQIL